MRRRDGVLLVLIMFIVFPAVAFSLALWTIPTCIVLFVVLFLFMLHCALFVWPDMDEL